LSLYKVTFGVQASIGEKCIVLKPSTFAKIEKFLYMIEAVVGMSDTSLPDEKHLPGLSVQLNETIKWK